MRDELEYINKNNGWELMELSNSIKTIRCKQVLKRKFKIDRSLKWYNARLVVKGYSTQLGVDVGVAYSSMVNLHP